MPTSRSGSSVLQAGRTTSTRPGWRTTTPRRWRRSAPSLPGPTTRRAQTRCAGGRCGGCAAPASSPSGDTSWPTRPRCIATRWSSSPTRPCAVSSGPPRRERACSGSIRTASARLWSGRSSYDHRAPRRPDSTRSWAARAAARTCGSILRRATSSSGGSRARWSWPSPARRLVPWRWLPGPTLDPGGRPTAAREAIELAERLDEPNAAGRRV